MALIRLFGQTTVATVKKKLRQSIGAEVVLYDRAGQPARDNLRLSQLREDAPEQTSIKIFGNAKVSTIETHFYDNYKCKIDILNPDGSVADNEVTLGSVRRLYTGERVFVQLDDTQKEALKAKAEAAQDVASYTAVAEEAAAAGDIRWATTLFLHAKAKTSSHLTRLALAQKIIDITEDIPLASEMIEEDFEAIQGLDQSIEFALFYAQHLDENAKAAQLLKTSIQQAEDFEALERLALVAVEELEDETLAKDLLQRCFKKASTSENYLELAEIAAEQRHVFRNFIEEALEQAENLATTAEDWSDLAEFYGEVFENYPKAKSLIQRAIKVAKDIDDWLEIFDDLCELAEANPTLFPDALLKEVFERTLQQANTLSALELLKEDIEVDNETLKKEFTQRVDTKMEKLRDILLNSKYSGDNFRIEFSGAVTHLYYGTLRPEHRQALEQALDYTQVYEDIESMLIDLAAEKSQFIDNFEVEVVDDIPLFQQIAEACEEENQYLFLDEVLCGPLFVIPIIDENIDFQIENADIEKVLFKRRLNAVHWDVLDDLPEEVQTQIQAQYIDMTPPPHWKKMEQEAAILDLEVAENGILRASYQLEDEEFLALYEEIPAEERVLFTIEQQSRFVTYAGSNGELNLRKLLFYQYTDLQQQQTATALNQVIYDGELCEIETEEFKIERVTVRLGADAFPKA